MQHDNLVIVAGAAVTPFGLNTSDFCKGINGGGYLFEEHNELTGFVTDTKVNSASISTYDAKKALNTRAVSQLDQLTKHVSVATLELQKNLGCDDVESRKEKVSDDQLSIVLGTTGPVQSVIDFDIEAFKEPQYVAAGLFPNVVFNVPGCHASIRHKARGSVLTLNDGDTASANAIKLACGQLTNNRSDMVWVGGAEALNPAQVLMLKAQQNFINEPVLPDLAEGVFLFAMTRKETAQENDHQTLAEIETTAALFCPDKDLALKKLIEKLVSDCPEEMKEVTWLSSNLSAPIKPLGYDVKAFNADKKLGYLAAATSAASLMCILASHEVNPGERVLHICQDENGASSAILLRKTKHL